VLSGPWPRLDGEALASLPWPLQSSADSDPDAVPQSPGSPSSQSTQPYPAPDTDPETPSLSLQLETRPMMRSDAIAGRGGTGGMSKRVNALRQKGTGLAFRATGGGDLSSNCGAVWRR
jgi:hypothetical protein